MSSKTLRKVFVLSLLAVSLASSLAYGVASAKPNGTKPGWGWGDKNRDHTGPPGSTVATPPGGFPTPNR